MSNPIAPTFWDQYGSTNIVYQEVQLLNITAEYL